MFTHLFDIFRVVTVIRRFSVLRVGFQCFVPGASTRNWPLFLSDSNKRKTRCVALEICSCSHTEVDAYQSISNSFTPDTSKDALFNSLFWHPAGMNNFFWKLFYLLLGVLLLDSSRILKLKNKVGPHLTRSFKNLKIMLTIDLSVTWRDVKHCTIFSFNGLFLAVISLIKSRIWVVGRF